MRLIEKIRNLWDKWTRPREFVDDSPFPELRISPEILDALKETREDRRREVIEGIVYVVLIIALILFLLWLD
jgi:hypothetical protein